MDSIILRTYYQIYYKARDVLYANRTFQFNGPPTLALFQKNLYLNTTAKILLLKVANTPSKAVNLKYSNDTKPVELLLAAKDRVIINNLRIIVIKPL